VLYYLEKAHGLSENFWGYFRSNLAKWVIHLVWYSLSPGISGLSFWQDNGRRKFTAWQRLLL